MRDSGGSGPPAWKQIPGTIHANPEGQGCGMAGKRGAEATFHLISYGIDAKSQHFLTAANSNCSWQSLELWFGIFFFHQGFSKETKGIKLGFPASCPPNGVEFKKEGNFIPEEWQDW